MDGDAPGTQVVDPQHAADDVAAQVVKDEDLPDGLAIVVEDRGGLGGQAVGGLVEQVGGGREVVEVEDALNRR